MKLVSDISELEDCQIRFIVTRLAELTPHDEIKSLVEEVYDLQIEGDLLFQMMPHLPGLCVLDDHWKQLFYHVRDELFLALYNLPIAGKVYRLKKLQEWAERFEVEGNVEGLIRCLEDARLETGPVYQELVRILKEKNSEPVPRKTFKA